jgi:putative flippase GtrA
MADISPSSLETAHAGMTAPPSVTVVVPTRNEADNVVPLVDQVGAAFGDLPIEILFVDDSDDETPATVRAAAERLPGRVRLLHRPPGERDGGLGGAVTAGLSAARAPWVVVMDGDLQHPPRTAPELLAAGRSATAQAVVASRYRARGRVDGLDGWWRRIVSRGSGLLAKAFFPRRLRAVSDPMSGFFAVRRDAVRPGDLRPDGYKILLEVLVRNRIDRVTEVSYTFGQRAAGESKTSVREGLRFARHLTALRLATLLRPHSTLGRMTGFAMAGATGTAVNSLALWALGGPAHLPYLLAALLAVQVAILWNFAVIDRLVMPPGDHRFGPRFGRFLLLNNTLTPVHLGLLYAFVRWGGLHYLGANVLAIVLVFALRYLVTSAWVYGASPAGELNRMVRRTAQTRLLLAVLLAAVACPALLTIGWGEIWERGHAVPLIIPVAASVALALGRARPSHGEPDVHDRQVDGLLAFGFLGSAAALMLLAPTPTPITWLVPAALSYVSAAAVLLLGTRAAARMRFALLPPLLAMVSTDATAFSTTLRVAGVVATVPGLAVAGAVVCLLIAGVAASRVRAVPLAVVVLAVVTFAAAILTYRFGAPPILIDGLLAVVVAGFAARWNRPETLPALSARKRYLPRGRFAFTTLVAVAVVLGLLAYPHLTWHAAVLG